MALPLESIRATTSLQAEPKMTPSAWGEWLAGSLKFPADSHLYLTGKPLSQMVSQVSELFYLLDRKWKIRKSNYLDYAFIFQFFVNIKKDARRKRSKLPCFVSLGLVTLNVIYFYLNESKWYVSVLENLLKSNGRHIWMLIMCLPLYYNVISSKHHSLALYTPCMHPRQTQKAQVVSGIDRLLWSCI